MRGSGHVDPFEGHGMPLGTTRTRRGEGARGRDTIPVEARAVVCTTYGVENLPGLGENGNDHLGMARREVVRNAPSGGRIPPWRWGVAERGFVRKMIFFAFHRQGMTPRVEDAACGEIIDQVRDGSIVKPRRRQHLM